LLTFGGHIVLTIFAVLALLTLAACGETPAVPEHAEALYRRYCASCHGLTGHGDGPAADALSPRPTDLTTSALDLPELMKVIDGRRTVRAHGSAAMPVWGQEFEESLPDDSRTHRQALRQVQAVAEYVQALRAATR
jgi:mono/diheme cytochrome c family protein